MPNSMQVLDRNPVELGNKTSWGTCVVVATIRRCFPWNDFMSATKANKSKAGRRSARVRHQLARKVDVQQPSLLAIPAQPQPRWKDPEQRKP